MSSPSHADETAWRPEVLAFLRDIKANPDDDTPRLILADWLQEHGDEAAAARGEMIRLQCRALSTSRVRQAELLQQYAVRWLGPLAPVANSWSSQRGLLHLAVDARVLLGPSSENLVQDEAFAWVEGLTLRHLNDRLARSLAMSSWLTWINTLDLGFNGLGDAGAGVLASSLYLQNLRTLVLRQNRIGDAGAAALARSTGLPNLRTLSLAENRIRNTGGLALASSPLLDQLTFLNLDGNRLSDATNAALSEAVRCHPRLWLHRG
jgi:uncharacterized protein (TIGR02996 family)